MIQFLASVSAKGHKGYLYQLQSWVTLPQSGSNYGLRVAGLCAVGDVNHHAEHAIAHITVELSTDLDKWHALEATGTWYNDLEAALVGAKPLAVAA